MQFKQEIDIFSADEMHLGQVERVVLDPATYEFTHVVMRGGGLFNETKLIPLDLIDTADEERVTLNQDFDQLSNLPPFEEVHYISVEDDEVITQPADHAPPVFWYPPMGSPWWNYPDELEADSEDSPTYIANVEQNIPDETVVVIEGADVVSADEKHMGNVISILTDPATQKVTHILISRGTLLKEKKLIPTMWFDTVAEEQIRLKIRASLVEKLPEYEE